MTDIADSVALGFLFCLSLIGSVYLFFRARVGIPFEGIICSSFLKNVHSPKIIWLGPISKQLKKTGG